MCDIEYIKWMNNNPQEYQKAKAEEELRKRREEILAELAALDAEIMK